jgi:hypothetical protein
MKKKRQSVAGGREGGVKDEMQGATSGSRVAVQEEGKPVWAGPRSPHRS